jgi:hypothetical protein
VRPGSAVDPKPISAEAPAAQAPMPPKPASAEAAPVAPVPAIAKPQPALGAAAAERRS